MRHRGVRRWAPWVVAVAVAAGAGCATPAGEPRGAAAPENPAPPLHDGPLTDFVPAAGLRWMVVGSPRELGRDPALAPAIAMLLPGERLDAFAKSSGVDLRTTPSALVAGFDHATLYLAESTSTDLVERRFLDRLVSGPVAKQPHPRIRRVVGTVGATPQTLVTVKDRRVAVAVGSSLPAKIAELYARQKLKRSPTALRGSALSALPADLHSAPARFYAPGPFSDEWARGARGLLAATVAVGLAVRTRSGKLALSLVLAGDFGAIPDAPTRLEGVWTDLAGSPLGRLLGLDTPASGPSVTGTPELVRLEVELEPMPLASGLRAAVLADVWEILGIEPPR